MATEPARQLQLLTDGTQRLIRTVDAFQGDDWTVPSRLPDWSRAHVVAHLALNAEGLAGALTGIVTGEPTPMYASDEARNADIAELAAADHTEIRERLLAGCTEYADAFAALPADRVRTRLERSPGSEMTFSAAASVLMRLREVEIHHADLAADYTHHDWPPPFTEVLLESMTKRPWATRFTVEPNDLDGRWTYGPDGDGADGPTVTGTAADLGWWLTGRGSGEGLTCANGDLPTVTAW